MNVQEYKGEEDVKGTGRGEKTREHIARTMYMWAAWGVLFASWICACIVSDGPRMLLNEGVVGMGMIVWIEGLKLAVGIRVGMETASSISVISSPLHRAHEVGAVTLHFDTSVCTSYIIHHAFILRDVISSSAVLPGFRCRRQGRA